MAPPSSSSAPPPPSSWVILGSITRVSAAADGSDVSVELTAPPRVSILTVSPRVFPEPATTHYFPFVLCTDPSGLLLLQANLGCPETQETIQRRRNHSTFLKYWTSRYFVLDATTSSAFQLPDPEPAYAIHHQAQLGLVLSPSGDGHYMVAEFQQIIGCEKATLLCFSSERGKWFEKKVDYPVKARPWTPIGVVSHHGRLWWIDLSWGVINFDPFTNRPDLGLVPFPPGTVLDCREGWGVTDQYRYVGVSGGKLRFVDTYTRGGGTPKVSVWTLADPDSTEWTLEHEATFTEIWADKTYKATRMPKKIPVLALIHPKNPRVVYFFLEKNLFGVDVRTRKVVECKVYGLVAPPSCHIASRFLRAWELPQPLPSGMNKWCKGINSAEKAKGRVSNPSPGDYALVGMTMQTFIG
ncbi:hypothetical protein ACQ4PT_034709 [Festuca glaucescens]